MFNEWSDQNPCQAHNLVFPDSNHLGDSDCPKWFAELSKMTPDRPWSFFREWLALNSLKREGILSAQLLPTGKALSCSPQRKICSAPLNPLSELGVEFLHCLESAQWGGPSKILSVEVLPKEKAFPCLVLPWDGRGLSSYQPFPHLRLSIQHLHHHPPIWIDIEIRVCLV